VLLSAHDLRLNIDVLEQGVQAMRKTLDARVELPPELDVLELVFESEPTVDNLQIKLGIIRDMYASVSEAIAGGEPKELTVYRIEAGTLSLQLIGHFLQNLVIMMGIRSALADSFRHVTRPGQLATFREEQAALQAFLDNAGRVESQLGPSADTRAALEQILAHQTERARQLLTNENYLWLNGLPFVRAGKENRGLLGRVEVPRLESGEPTRRRLAKEDEEV
jgi:hypothetical protein